MDIKLLNFEIHGDNQGSLISLEQQRNIPFEIKRVYYIFGTKKNIRRGLHAHKHLQQVIVAISGSCKFLLDDGYKTKEFVLNNPSQGLFVDACVWHEMFDFSEDCVLLVLADEFYDERDYIRVYDSFDMFIKEKDKLI